MVHQRSIRSKKEIRVDIGSLPPNRQSHPACERQGGRAERVFDVEGVGKKGHQRTGELTVKAALATAAKAAATETLVEKSILIYVFDW